MTDIEQLYERYARDVYRFALYLSGSPALADDITSETFVRVFTSHDAIRTSTVKAYLFTIARNLYTDERRREARGTEMPAELPDSRAGLQIQAEARQSLDLVLAALQKLPRTDRAALLMRAQDDMPYDEIAASLGISLAAAKVKVHRARLRLTELASQRPELEKERVRKP